MSGLTLLCVQDASSEQTCGCDLHACFANDHALTRAQLTAAKVELRSGVQRKTEARIGPFNGAPTLFINGAPQFAMWYYQNVPPKQPEIAAFGQVGVNVITGRLIPASPANSRFYPTWPDLPFGGWIGPGKYDYSEMDRIITKVLEANPDAYFVPRVAVGAPIWWMDAYSEEAVRMADGTGWVNNDWGGTKRESFASLKWRQDAAEAMRRLIRHVYDSPYGDRVIGYHLAGGIHFEWLAWSPFMYPDTSEPMRAAFRDYVQTKYGQSEDALRKAWRDPKATFEGLVCPGVAERKSGNVGVFRDPARSRYVSDYYEVFHKVGADIIESLCRVVKDESDGKLLTIAFYGYWPDNDWAVEADQRALPQMEHSPYLDCYSAPHSYQRRALGQGAFMRSHPASLQLHGKLFISEDDDRTHLSRPEPGTKWVDDLKGSVAIMWRGFANSLTHNVGLWFVDWHGEFNDPILMAEIGRAKRWGDYALTLPRKRTAQVALVYAPQSDFYMTGRDMQGHTSGLDHVTVPLFVGQKGELEGTGAPYDTYLIDDLADPAMPDYDCYVMLECFYLTDAQRATVRQKAMRPGKTVVWFYAPGLVTERGISIKAMSSLTGIRLALTPQSEKLRLVIKSDNPAFRPALVSQGNRLVFGVDAIQSPTFRCIDPQAVVLGKYEGSGEPGMVVKKVGGCRSVYCAAPLLPAAVLRNIFRQAGVHIYSDSGDPVYANESFLAVHTATGGRKVFRLPEARPVYDITEDKFVSKQPVTSFTVDIPKHETRAYCLAVPKMPPETPRRSQK
jgi:hypothetical protein